ARRRRIAILALSLPGGAVLDALLDNDASGLVSFGFQGVIPPVSYWKHRARPVNRLATASFLRLTDGRRSDSLATPSLRSGAHIADYAPLRCSRRLRHRAGCRPVLEGESAAFGRDPAVGQSKK